MEHINIFLTDVGEYQQAGYEYILETMKHKAKTIVTKTGKEKQLPSFDNMESFGDSGSILWMKMMELVRKVETYEGWYLPQYSIVEKP